MLGAGYLSSSSGEFVREPTNHYFCTCPHHFIQDHLPMNDKWQLVDTTVTREEFYTSLCVKPAYYELGITQCSVEKCAVTCNYKYQFNLGLSKHVRVTYELRLVDTGEAFNSFLHVHITENQAEFTILPPRIGRYSVIIYGCGTEKATSVRRVLEFTLDCKQAFTAISDLNTLCFHYRKCVWGPSELFHKLDLGFFNSFQSIVQTDEGKAFIRLQTGLVSGVKFHGEVPDTSRCSDWPLCTAVFQP